MIFPGINFRNEITFLNIHLQTSSSKPGLGHSVQKFVFMQPYVNWSP